MLGTREVFRSDPVIASGIANTISDTHSLNGCGDATDLQAMTYAGIEQEMRADAVQSVLLYRRGRGDGNRWYLVAFVPLLILLFPRAQADQIVRDSIQSDGGIVLKGDDHLITPGRFRPPVEITIVARTDSTNLRLAYAADQVIFNWEFDEGQLRVDGGPANGKHKLGAGRIPVNQDITIKWVVMRDQQSIDVDGERRFEDAGDYSGINRPVVVFPANGSVVTVRSIVVKPLIEASASAVDLEAWRRARPTLLAARETAPLPPTALYDLAAPSVYVVAASGGGSAGIGSAVAVSDHALLTNCHVVLGHKTIVLRQHDARGTAMLAHVDAEADRCFINTDDMMLHPIQGVRRFKDLHVGESVYSLGTPDGLEQSFSGGMVSGLRDQAGRHLVQHTAPTWPGSSGGGLFDARGNLIGITNESAAMAGAPGLNLAIAADDYWP
jgi:hypothetical protein